MTPPLRVQALVVVALTLGPMTLLCESVRAQVAATGSNVPCAVPLTWTIASIDPRFGRSHESALQAAREAAALWEGAAGTALFAFEAEGGHPIVFEYDERQAGVEARRDLESVLEAERSDVERQRVELEEAGREYETSAAEYEQELEDQNRAVRAYNDDMERWSREREIPPSVRTELERRKDELDRSSEELRSRERELSRLGDALQRDVDRFNERVDALTRAQAAFNRDFPTAASESGLYDEVVTTEDGVPVSVERRIRVFWFASYEDLVVILAHELGHALGLGHASGGGAVMSAVVVASQNVVPTGAVTPTDVSMLGSRCPGLARRSPGGPGGPSGSPEP